MGRTWLMKSRTCWISLEMVDVPSTIWTSRGAVWKWRRRSCRELWRRLRELLSRKKTRCLEPLWSWARSDRKLTAVEGAVHTMHAEIDDMLQQAKSSEEKAKKAMVDPARLADELRAEQDHTNA